MILHQRKQHLYRWILLGVLLPLGWALAVFSVPEYPVQSPVFPAEALPASSTLVRQYEDKQLKMSQWQLGPDTLKLALLLKKPLPEVYLYKPQGSGKGNSQSLGQLGAQKTYLFDLKTTDFQGIQIVSALSKEIVGTFIFPE